MSAGIKSSKNALIDFAGVTSAQRTLQVGKSSNTFYGFNSAFSSGDLVSSIGGGKTVRLRNGVVTPAITALEDNGSQIYLQFAANMPSNTDIGGFRRIVITNASGTTVSLLRSAATQNVSTGDNGTALATLNWTTSSTVLSAKSNPTRLEFRFD